MNIAIVIHTQSGHTLKFARAIQSRLEECGHEVEVKGLRTIGTVKARSTKFKIKNPPELEEYDAVLFGGPVWGFTASPVIMKFLGTLGVLKGKKALCFVTMFFPFPFMGGNQAIKAMEQELDMSGADLLSPEILRYGLKVNQEKMNSAVERICKSFC
ncbi:hypothetical protein QA601_17260 [Chitinispirillales bacterium ANBcel5]|uniref:flavodoxin family protein n=1 Tax=Cellulosispirillum alkaliphilum TaxID=3039283 RepID=UPI002A53EA0E|nr:hypothetical protein [Chitinispirillales bacterium ANBcel5]